ncbi:hypothetical protein DFJ74DRAFT_143563 [Hyaloraphidium curvatum]|nr:hypothetical protein DFJ74DRAFT_143563 [Hyaloraphidium curvatum]
MGGRGEALAGVAAQEGEAASVHGRIWDGSARDVAQVAEDLNDPDFLYVRALAVILEDGIEAVPQVEEILKKGASIKKPNNKCQTLAQTFRRITDLRHQANIAAKNKPLEANAMLSQCMSLFARISDPAALGWFAMDAEALDAIEDDAWRQGGYAGVRVLVAIGQANLAAKHYGEAQSAYSSALQNLFELLNTGPDNDPEPGELPYPEDLAEDGSPWLGTLAAAHAGHGQALSGLRYFSEAVDEFAYAVRIAPKNAEYATMFRKAEEDEIKDREAQAAAEAEAARQRAQEEARRKKAAEEQARAKAKAKQQQQQAPPPSGSSSSRPQGNGYGGFPGGGGGYGGSGKQGTGSSSRSGGGVREGKVNYFEVLGVSEEASDDEIKRAYKYLALQCHPDRHVAATEEERFEQEQKFKVVSEAYTVLSDPDKRRQWEMGDDDFGFEINLEDILMQMFMSQMMGGGRGGGARRGGGGRGGSPFASFFFGGGFESMFGFDDDDYPPKRGQRSRRR